MKQLRRIVIFPFVVLVKFYQFSISPLLPHSCRHVPTCSAYTIEALKVHGLGKGLYLGIRRILRCHPWGTHGYDPVPPAKKHNNSAFILPFALLVFASCSQPKPQTEQLIVSIAPQAWLLHQLIGDSSHVETLLTLGASPVTYEPGMQQIKKLQQSSHYIMIGGLDFELAWQEKFQHTSKQTKFVTLSSTIEKLEGHHHHEEHHSHTEMNDPHFWTSPKQVLHFLPLLKQVLNETEWADSSTLNANYQQLTAQIMALDSMFTADFSSNEKNTFLIYHPALSYLARDYRLTQLALEKDGKEPGLLWMNTLKSEAEQKNIQYIFIQKQFNKKNAQVLANQINAEVIEIDPLAYNWLNTMYDIHDKLQIALSNKHGAYN